MGIRSVSMAVNVWLVIQMVLKSFVNLTHPELNTKGISYSCRLSIWSMLVEKVRHIPSTCPSLSLMLPFSSFTCLSTSLWKTKTVINEATRINFYQMQFTKKGHFPWTESNQNGKPYTHLPCSNFTFSRSEALSASSVMISCDIKLLTWYRQILGQMWVWLHYSSEAPWGRKIGKPSSRENLVMTSVYEQTSVRPSAQTIGGGRGFSW